METDDPTNVSRADADSRDGFNSLLSLLDSNRDQAGVKYESVRRRLTLYFRRRSCSSAEDLVDETFKRVAVKLAAGLEIGDIDLYWFGVARFVLKEYWAALGKQIPSLADPPEPFVDPAAVEAESEDARLEDRKNQCMRDCFQSLADEERNLLIEYCGKGNKKQTASLIGTKLQTLRVKVHRLRKKLKKCLDNCVRNSRAYEI